MCGNGLRCVAAFLAAEEGKSEAKLVVDTDAGPLGCLVGHGQVEVEMGQLVEKGAVELPLEGRIHKFVRLSIGNPHAVTSVTSHPDSLTSLAARGPSTSSLRSSPLPARAKRW